MTGLGEQGGSRTGAELDLSSCVNPYGPAPAALDVLRTLPPAQLRRHPYGASRELGEALTAGLDVDPRLAVAGAGASGLLWRLAASLRGRRVVLPLPSYTEFLLAFPDATTVPSATGAHDAAQLAAAMSAGQVVVLSNPHNPSGSWLPPDMIRELCHRHPQTLLVVDESYADFLPGAPTAFVDALPNLVCLRSPTKFYGLGAARVGVALVAEEGLRHALLDGAGTWPLSGIDTAVAVAAVADQDWAHEARRWLAEDSGWLERYLQALPGIEVAPGTLPFRLVTGQTAPLLADLDRRNVAVRLLRPRHGVPGGALRIAAPPRCSRHLLER